MSRLHLRGRVLPDSQPAELWVHDSRISHERVAGAETVCDGGWILPGLVDAHCHVGIRYGGGPDDLAGAVDMARVDRDTGVLLLRDAGSPIDTRALDHYDDLPRIIRAGRHIARPKRYLREIGVELEDPLSLPEMVAEQARRGDGWVKIIGDWIDRSIGDLAPLFDDETLRRAIDAAHRLGARVTAHVFGEDALPGLIEAGIDCIEHGTGLTDDTIELMQRHGTALVPTLINIETFPDIAASAGKYPRYAAHMRHLHARVRRTVGNAHDAGIPIYAGTDAGGSIRHGRIADEVAALVEVGLTPTDALGAACWDARRWLGRPGLDHGAPADVVVYHTDPGIGPEVLSHPDLVILGGRIAARREPVTAHR